MKTNTTSPDYKAFRFPSEIINHAVWLYFRFSLSFHDVEEILAQRGIVVTYETVRQWCLKFGQTYANELRRRRPRCGDKWHMDEMVPQSGQEAVGDVACKARVRKSRLTFAFTSWGVEPRRCYDLLNEFKAGVL